MEKKLVVERKIQMVALFNKEEARTCTYRPSSSTEGPEVENL